MVKIFHLKEENKMEETTINLILGLVGLIPLLPFAGLLMEEITGGRR
jgi:hypothetical protein